MGIIAKGTRSRRVGGGEGKQGGRGGEAVGERNGGGEGKGKGETGRREGKPGRRDIGTIAKGTRRRRRGGGPRWLPFLLIFYVATGPVFSKTVDNTTGGKMTMDVRNRRSFGVVSSNDAITDVGMDTTISSSGISPTSSNSSISSSATSISSTSIAKRSTSNTSGMASSSHTLTSNTSTLISSSPTQSTTTTQIAPHCIPHNQWSFGVDKPRYADEHKGKEATVRWRFPHGYKSEYGNKFPAIQIELTEVDNNRTTRPSCTSFYDRNSHYGGGMFFFGGGRPSGGCSCSGNSCSTTLDLTAETKYRFVMSVRSKGVTLCPYETTTSAGIPPRMPGLVLIPRGREGEETTTYRIAIQIHKYKNDHGKLRSVSIGLAKNVFLEAAISGWGQRSMRSFFNYNIKYAKYRVYDNLSTSMASFGFGEDKPDPNKDTKCQDCNWPLEPNTNYRFKIRVYTSAGFRDVSVKSFATDDLPPTHPAIIVGIVLLVVVVVVVAAISATKCMAPAPGALSPQATTTSTVSWTRRQATT